MINEKGFALIKAFEGRSLSAYLDVAGYPTIGYGHRIRPGENFSGGISEQQAEDLLQNDARKAEAAVGRLIKIPLNENQKAALVSFVYNLGAASLQRSTLRKLILRGARNDAICKEWCKWCFAGRPPKKNKGLLTRRYEESQLFIEPLIS